MFIFDIIILQMIEIEWIVLHKKSSKTKYPNIVELLEREKIWEIKKPVAAPSTA